MNELNAMELSDINGGAKTSTILLGCASMAACFAGPAGIFIGIALSVYTIATDD